MKTINVKQVFLVTAVFAFGTLASVTWSPNSGLSLVD